MNTTVVILAAGLGTGFDLGSLAVVAGRSRESISADLQPALEAGLVAVNGVTPGDPHRSDVLVFVAPALAR